MFFHTLTFAGSLGSCLNSRQILMNETNMYDPYSCIFTNSSFKLPRKLWCRFTFYSPFMDIPNSIL